MSHLGARAAIYLDTLLPPAPNQARQLFKIVLLCIIWFQTPITPGPYSRQAAIQNQAPICDITVCYLHTALFQISHIVPG